MIRVEIWSDIVCPFCYIGKKRLEKALESFSEKDTVEVVWKSYQLDPEQKSKKYESALAYMVESKGLTEEAVDGMFQHVEQMAGEEGLTYDLKRTVPANTLRAHRLIQLAKEKGVGELAEEQLFKSHFLDFEDVDDHNTLKAVGQAIGLSEAEVDSALTDKKYEEMALADIYEAQQVGVRGVPFFVFNQKYAISGAQPVEVLLETLDKLKEEY